MTEFRLTIECDNAAFDPRPDYELARLLRETALRIEGGDTDHAIRDSNGNTVGSCTLLGVGA